MVAYSLHILLFTYRVVYIAAFQLIRQEILSIYASDTGTMHDVNRV